MVVVACWSDYLDAHERGEVWLSGHSLGGLLSAMVAYLPAYTVVVAVVVFSTCLFVVVPLLNFFPRA